MSMEKKTETWGETGEFFPRSFSYLCHPSFLVMGDQKTTQNPVDW